MKFTLAIAVLLLLHIPPELTSVKVVLLLLHTADAPIIAPGVWFTVTTTVAGVPHPFA